MKTSKVKEASFLKIRIYQNNLLKARYPLLFERSLRKSQSAKLIELPTSSIIETPFSKLSMKEKAQEKIELTLTPKNLEKIFKDFSKHPPQSTKNAISQSHTFVGGSQGLKSLDKNSSQGIKEKKDSFGMISKDITKTILTQMNNKVMEI